MTRFYQLLFVVAFSLTLISCNKNDLSPGESAQSAKACNVDEPTKELLWLKEIITKAEDPHNERELCRHYTYHSLPGTNIYCLSEAPYELYGLSGIRLPGKSGRYTIRFSEAYGYY